MRPWCVDGAVVIEPRLVWPAIKLDVAVPRPLSASFVAGYIKKVGVKRVAHKVQSRLLASASDALHVILGAGIVRQSKSPDYGEGDVVCFCATRAREGSKYLTVPDVLVRAWHGDLPAKRSVVGDVNAAWPEALDALAGWSIHSDDPLDERACAQIMSWLVSLNLTRDVQPSAASERAAHKLPPVLGGRPQVVLFGYGHYARTCLMPHLTQHYDVARVHEIDESLTQATPRWSTSALPEPGDELAHIWHIAGYHHHHARLAILGCEAGVDLFVEKPLVTTARDLDALLHALKTSQARIWQGFHRRTWQVAEWIQKDLEIQRGTSTVHMHCVVHEVSLLRITGIAGSTLAHDSS